MARTNPTAKTVRISKPTVCACEVCPREGESLPVGRAWLCDERVYCSPGCALEDVRGRTAPRSNPRHVAGFDYLDDVLDELVKSTAESNEDPEWRKARASEETIALAEKFIQAVKNSIDTWGASFSEEATDELFGANAPYLVLMTLRGEGVGIWDGSWDKLLTKAQIKDCQARMQKDKKLQKAFTALEDSFREDAYVQGPQAALDEYESELGEYEEALKQVNVREPGPSSWRYERGPARPNPKRRR